MSYEFDGVYFELIIKDMDKFEEFTELLEQIDGTAYMPNSLTLEALGYADYYWKNKEEVEAKYPNVDYIKIKRSGCYKWKNMQEWLNIFNKYCLGDVVFEGESGELVTVSFNDKENYEISVQRYKEVPIEEWGEQFCDCYFCEPRYKIRHSVLHAEWIVIDTWKEDCMVRIFKDFRNEAKAKLEAEEFCKKINECSNKGLEKYENSKQILQNKDIPK